MELGILHNSPPSTKRGCRAGRLHRLWHGLPPAPWPCTRSQHHSVPSRNLHPLMVPPFLQPHPDLQSAVGNTPLSFKHPAQLPTTDCLLSIISPMGGQPSDAPALSPPSPLQQGGQSSNAPALSPPSPLPQGGQPIALALSPPSPPPQGGQPSDAPGLSPSSSTLLLCPSDSTLNICHLNSQSAVKTVRGVDPELIADFDEEGRPLHHHNGGDGASASSTGTASPDIFQEEEGEGGGSDQKDSDGQGQGPGPPTPTPTPKILPNSPTFPLLPHEHKEGKNDIIVTKRDFTVVPSSTLRVRRGSEPALNTLGDDAIQKPLIPINNGIIALHRHDPGRDSEDDQSDSSDDDKSGKSSFEKKKKALIARFSRDAFRTSLSNRPEMFVWMEAQDRQEEKFRHEDKFKQVIEERKGPIGASTTDNNTPASIITNNNNNNNKHQDTASPGCVIITLDNDGGPLGIHVVPASDDNGRDMGLM
ncbi:hypothetical protein ACOMHN_023441 [Nucella lapillus]